MRTLVFLLGLGLFAPFATADEKPVRNPFDRIGVARERETISPDYHLARAKRLAAEAEARRRQAAEEAARAEAERAARLETEKAARKTAAKAAKAAPVAVPPRPAPALVERRAATDEEWTTALKSIHFGGRIRVTNADGTRRANVILDGTPFGEGALKSVVSGGRKFTWRVTGIEGDAPRLKLLRVNESILKPATGGTR